MPTRIFFIKSCRLRSIMHSSGSCVSLRQGDRGDRRVASGPLESKTPRAEVIAAADLLLNGKADIGGKTVELGPPGKVDWYYPLPYGEMQDPQNPDTLPNPVIASGQVLMPLARAFVLTKDPKYLKAWQDYMEDWSLNATYMDRIHPCFVPSVVNSSAYAGIGFVKALAAVQASLPNGERALPSMTFARSMERFLIAYPLLSQVYIRSNTHNWTPTSSAMALALVGDELISSPLLFGRINAGASRIMR